ncbi:glycosyltransferase [Pyrinomonas methylaliphatogenes]|uniref:Glycosyltransferase n=1 Tax=Pyrinomonas methylaliphatogenes TaxID=454194 RepID=A0A0B6WYS1_9BACT|nr:glycosyltransferase [Pyrinomonas methylaliphatogenes]CDM66246.1 glycosyltransferase [Pyrinomonas methylaliphatogenes]
MHILWLKTELLHPVDKGGKIRTYQMLRELKREHRITYLTLDDGSGGERARAQAFEYCHDLVVVPHRTHAKFTLGFYFELAINLFSSLPYFIKKYASEKMRHEIERLLSSKRYDVLVCDFLQPSINVPSQLNCASVLFQHNVEAVIWKRHYQVQQDLIKKAYLYGQWLKARAYERAACQRFDFVVAVSHEDAELMKHEYGIKAVAYVPTGVDTEYFRPRNNACREPHNLVFTGSMDWLPNEDAIKYFTENIMPLIKRIVPDVTLTVVGRNPYPSLIELSQRDPSVIVTGRVDDVRPYMERAAVYVVPIRIGGGTRLKIYEAMAMEMPIVSTTVGAEGLPVRDGLHLLLADDPESFAAATVRLLFDREFARELGRRGAMLVREQFGWANVARKFAELCEYAIKARSGNSLEILG